MQQINFGNILEQEISTSVGDKEIKDKAKVDLNYVNSQLQNLNDNTIFQLQKKVFCLKSRKLAIF